MISNDQHKIQELLTRGVENIFPNPDFLEKELKSGRQLTLYTGYDPTAPTLHIGNGITLLKLRQFQDLGHKIIILIGDFTGMIGDPTDKSAVRKRLTREEVLENCKKYQDQAASVLKFDGENPAEIKFNSEWLGKMNFGAVLELAAHFTVQQILKRDMFEKRFFGEIWCVNCNKNILLPLDWKIGDPNPRCKVCENSIDPTSFKPVGTQPIYLHEFLYPLMQGYDSVVMDVDGEVGGNDQTFNMLAGRTLMKEIKGKEKFVLTIKLLADEHGKKMGKTEGNMVAFSDTPEDMFGKVMTWTDGMIVSAFELCTRLPIDEIVAIKKSLDAGANPRDAKLQLAFAITETFLGTKAAEQGRDNFAKVIQNKERPDEIPGLQPTAYDVVTILVEAGFVKSKSEAKREIDGGGIKVNDEKIMDYEMVAKSGDVIQKGKRFFVKVL